MSAKNKDQPASTKAETLGPNQARFVAEYLVDLNATQAAIRSGYSAKTAESQGSTLLRNPKVAAAVAAGKAKRTTRTAITQDQVLRELALLAFSDVNHYLIDDNGKLMLADGAPKHASRAVSSIKRRTRTDPDGAVTHEVELKLWDKPGPLKLAGRHVGLFNEKAKEEERPMNIHVHTGVAKPPEIAAAEADAAASGEKGMP